MKDIRRNEKDFLLRQLPGNIILCAQPLMTLLQGGKVTGGHHSGAVPRGTRNRKRAGDLLIRSSNNIEVIFLAFEGRWVS
jgi:hypothetical protein